ncbi:unnamed protein product [Didymodactylos carnosus]|uniref:Uncharacterized protein n=1 Tax=Didymodactylos carnosus TaxID=1234261 RepID=A0A814CQS0_9BILA|nr:unnamed protein product [Didymodactylos carnosus]CAF3719754.1 unnamed protein product [Didymodactylos carnosus]
MTFYHQCYCLPLYNTENSITYYDECRITVSPRIVGKPIRTYAQIQKPCNGTLLWSYPNNNLTLEIINLENEQFTFCIDQKSLKDKLIRSIVGINNDLPVQMIIQSDLSCATSTSNKLTLFITAEPLYAGIYLQYAMYNSQHPWNNGANPWWQRSEKYLYGPPSSMGVKRVKKGNRRRKLIHGKELTIKRV